MKQALRLIGKILRTVLLPPFLYLFVALFCTFVPVQEMAPSDEKTHNIYLSTNGVHLDIILPKELLSPTLLDGLNPNHLTQHLAFGWGDKDFYLNTPRWEDLKASTAFKAMFLTSETLMHVSRYGKARAHWVAVEVSPMQLEKINAYLENSFADMTSHTLWVAHKGYGNYDDFYRAKGSYSCFKTCNTWVNTAFKSSGMKACIWTPFDFGLLSMYKNEKT